MTSEQGLLVENFSDYVMPPDVTSVWIAVDNISVWICRSNEGVVVSLFPCGREMEDAMSTAYLEYTDAE